MITRVISDLHLNSPVSRLDKILQVLEIPCDTLILNGDVFDHDNRKLKKKEWKIFLLLKKISKTTKIIWIQGNHAPIIEPIFANLLDIEYVENLELSWNNKKIFICHGHLMDGWVQKKLISDFFTGLYYLIQLIDGRKRRISTWLKLKSKQILKTHKHLEERAIKYAKFHKYDIILVAHSHLEAKIEKDGILYVNSGSFCEIPCHYIEINDKEILLKEI